jgi:hypothetical protein
MTDDSGGNEERWQTYIYDPEKAPAPEAVSNNSIL